MNGVGRELERRECRSRERRKLSGEREREPKTSVFSKRPCPHRQLQRSLILPLTSFFFSFLLLAPHSYFQQLDAPSGGPGGSGGGPPQHQHQQNAAATAPAPPPAPPPIPAWRLRLNSGPLRAALAAAKARVGASVHAPFKTRVSKAAVPDYGRFVAPSQEMWLDKVRGRVERGEYECARQMARDVRAIAAAAEAYNAAEGGGACRAPALVGQARQLVEAVEAELEARRAEIEQAEAAGEWEKKKKKRERENFLFFFLLFLKLIFFSDFFFAKNKNKKKQPTAPPPQAPPTSPQARTSL